MTQVNPNPANLSSYLLDTTLGWLIDPLRRAVEIFRPDCESEIREDVVQVDGKGPVAGFVLDLSPVWEDPSD